MLPKLSRGLRLALMLTLSVGYIGYHGHTHAAYAKGDDDDSGDSDDPDEKGSDKEGEEGTDEPEEDKDQPPVTAGGLFTIKTYPVSELQRPLTITGGITQVKFSLGTDLSAKGAFGSVGVSLEGVYGVKDNFEVIGGFTSAYNTRQFSVYAGFEAALVYDLLDFRVAANFHRFAIPRFCGSDPDAPTTCDTMTAALPSGNYTAAGKQFSLDIGFPFRYAFAPQVAVVALQTLMSIDFNGVQRGDPSKRAMGLPAYCSGVNADMTDDMGNPATADQANCIQNLAKPDLNPSVGVALNPVDFLSVVIQAQLRVPDFDTSAGNFQVPVSARVEFSPSRQFDIGLEFTLLNVKPPDPQSPIDNRFLSAFAQARF